MRYYFSAAGHYSDLTLRENILFRPSLLAQPNASKRCDELLELVGVAHRADAYPDQCSGGEQRAAIAAAVIHRPSLILADEPAGSLDAENAEQVLKLFLNLRAHSGALVVVTHSQRVADRMDRQWAIDHGSITEHTPDSACVGDVAS